MHGAQYKAMKQITNEANKMHIFYKNTRFNCITIVIDQSFLFVGSSLFVFAFMFAVFLPLSFIDNVQLSFYKQQKGEGGNKRSDGKWSRRELKQCVFHRSNPILARWPWTTYSLCILFRSTSVSIFKRVKKS